MSDCLKPCPFCGSSDVHQSDHDGRVRCWGCDATDPNEWSDDIAAKAAAWNRRPSPWHLIKTAPRDGTRVLVCWQDTGVVESAEYIQGAGWTGAACFWIRDPTHWQPRPEAPE